MGIFLGFHRICNFTLCTLTNQLVAFAVNCATGTNAVPHIQQVNGSVKLKI